jgi:hypothetical protein
MFAMVKYCASDAHGMTRNEAWHKNRRKQLRWEDNFSSLAEKWKILEHSFMMRQSALVDASSEESLF